jgi:hypothetical protein
VLEALIMRAAARGQDGSFRGLTGKVMLGTSLSESDPYRPSAAYFCCDAQYTSELTM